MDNPGEIMRLCRLCLVKDQVNIPIFDEQGDIRQIFLKISSCLPVKVSKEDQLPKSICDGCSNKLDLLYEFRNSSVNAEKALLSWVSQAIKDVDETVGVATQPVAKPSETQVKEETLEECHAPLVHSNDSMDAQESAAFDENSAKEESDEPPPPKRARRTAAVKAQINIAPDSDDEDDDDLDIDAEPLTKIEDESDESDGDEKDDPSYPDVPGTSADDQPGPSGVGKDGVEAPHQCPICLKIYASQSSLKRHSYTHAEIKRFQKFSCSICILDFENNNSLQKHMIKLHSNEVSNAGQCPFCPRTFKNQQALKKHVWNYHDPNYKFNFVCSICDRVMAFKGSYVKHIETHNQEEPDYHKRKCVCEVCGKDILQKSIQFHMKYHLEVKPHKCEHCNKTFPNRTTLSYHVRTHTKEKPHKCPVCFKGFTQPYSVTIHMRYHTGERPFNCCVCKRGFVTKAELKLHSCEGSQHLENVFVKCEKLE